MYGLRLRVEEVVAIPVNGSILSARISCPVSGGQQIGWWWWGGLRFAKSGP